MKKEQVQDDSLDLLTLDQVCKKFNVSKMTVRRLEKQGRLMAVYIGERFKRYSKTELEKFIQNNQRYKR